MKNNPATIFDLSLHNAVIRNYLDIWQTGQISWEACLEFIYKALVKELRGLSKKHGIEENIEGYCNFKPKDRGCRMPLTPLWNDFMNLSVQAQLIEAIDEIAEVWDRFRTVELIDTIYPNDLSNSQLPRQAE